MPSRPPTLADFPSDLALDLIPPPTSSPSPTNILLLLHGLGDTHISFASLARRLALPETFCLAIRAPSPMPFDIGGFHWGDDIVFKSDSGGMDLQAGFARTTETLARAVQGVLMDKCGYGAREVLVFGFGQGGMAALALAASLECELGGVVTVGGTLPEASVSKGGAAKRRTPVLVLGGSSASLVTTSAVRSIKDTFVSVDAVTWQRRGDGMPTSRDEMLPIMKFFARRLRSRAGVPAGAVEFA